jgi:hypothetical protein
VIYLVIYWAIEYFGDTTFTQFQRELENGPAEAKIILPIILLLPFISLVLPLFIKKLRTTKNLAQYFFAFEIPFVAVVLNLIFPYIAGYSDSDSPYILTVLIISISPIITYLLSLHPKRYIPVLTPIIFVLQSLVTSLIMYFALLYSFFVFPMFASFISSFIESIVMIFSGRTGNGVMYLLVLCFYSIIILLLTTVVPYILVSWNTIRWKNFFTLLTTQFGMKKTQYISIATFILLLIIGIVGTIQPSRRYLEKLQQYAQSHTFEEKQLLARELQQNRSAALTEAEYLSTADNRYFFDSDYSLSESVYSSFIIPKVIATIIDTSFRWIASPYIYKYSFNSDYGSLSATVREIFNYDVYSGEPVTIQEDWQTRSTQVTLLDRAISITTQQEGKLALVTVTDTFMNLDFTDRETTTEFLLPTGSVVADLKLGMNLEFPGLVAPRGAAKKTYEAEVRRRRDPALLQEIGPDQYRLNVFPVPSNGQQKVQYSYITTLTPDGFGLPTYVQRTGFKESATFTQTTILDGNAAQPDNNFMASNVPFCDAQNGSVGSSQQSFIISSVAASTFYCTQPGKTTPLTDIVGKKITFLLDVSVQNQKSDAATRLSMFLQENPQILGSNTVFLEQANTLTAEPIQLTTENYARVLQDIVWFGSGNFDTILANVPQDADAVFYISSNEFSSNTPPQNINTDTNAPPLYLIYPDYLEAPNWNPVVADALFGREVSANRSLAEAWVRFAALENSPEHEIAINPYWQVVPITTSGTKLGELLPNTNSYTSSTIASDFPELYREYSDLFKQMTTTARGVNLRSPTDETLQILDGLTKRAQNLHVVTPLTSMVALVNETQVDRLEQNSQADDRYADWNTEFRGQPMTGGINPGIGWASGGGFGAALDSRSSLNSMGAAPFSAASNELGSLESIPGSTGNPSATNTLVLILLIVGAGGFIVYKKLRKKKTLPQ